MTWFPDPNGDGEEAADDAEEEAEADEAEDADANDPAAAP